MLIGSMWGHLAVETSSISGINQNALFRQKFVSPHVSNLSRKSVIYFRNESTDFQIFVLVSYVFSLNFSLILIFRCLKPILKSFVVEILFIGDYGSTFYLFDDKV